VNDVECTMVTAMQAHALDRDTATDKGFVTQAYAMRTGHGAIRPGLSVGEERISVFSWSVCHADNRE
jgi:hypothetical protein